jgi:hypothetical protein
MLAHTRKLRAPSSRTTEREPAAIRTLSSEETETVSGGFNPQPEPPGRALSNIYSGGFQILQFGGGGGTAFP